MKDTNYSEAISAAIKTMERARRDYEYSFDRAHTLDELTQDYLHSLELDLLTYSDRAKIATKLKRCRKERRECKDAVRVLEPLYNYITSEKGQHLDNMLKEVLGATRKAEKSLDGRVYRPRVLGKEPKDAAKNNAPVPEMP